MSIVNPTTPTTFYYSSPVIGQKSIPSNSTILCRFTLTTDIFRDETFFERIGHIVVNCILHNAQNGGVPTDKSLNITDATFHMYDDNNRWGIIRTHHAEKAVMDVNGMVASVAFGQNINANIIQATQNYRSLLPSNNIYKYLQITMSDNGTRKAVISENLQSFIEPKISYTLFTHL